MIIMVLLIITLAAVFFGGAAAGAFVLVVIGIQVDERRRSRTGAADSRIGAGSRGLLTAGRSLRDEVRK
jgi:hypothetical protein